MHRSGGDGVALAPSYSAPVHMPIWAAPAARSTTFISATTPTAAQRPVPLAAEYVPGRRGGRAGHSGGDRRVDGYADRGEQLIAGIEDRLGNGSLPDVLPSHASTVCAGPCPRPTGCSSRAASWPPVRGAGRRAAAARQPRLHHEQALRADRGRLAPLPRRDADRSASSTLSSCTPTPRRSTRTTAQDSQQNAAVKILELRGNAPVEDGQELDAQEVSDLVRGPWPAATSRSCCDRLNGEGPDRL